MPIYTNPRTLRLDLGWEGHSSSYDFSAHITIVPTFQGPFWPVHSLLFSTLKLCCFPHFICGSLVPEMLFSSGSGGLGGWFSTQATSILMDIPWEPKVVSQRTQNTLLFWTNMVRMAVVYEFVYEFRKSVDTMKDSLYQDLHISPY